MNKIMQPNEENNPNREIHEQIRTETANGQVNTSRTTSSVPAQNSTDAAHRSGYVQGAISENIRQENGQKLRDNDNAGRGLLVGIVMASVAGLVLASVYFLNRRDPSPLLVPVPGIDRSAPSSTRIIEREKTITERVEKAAPTSAQKAVTDSEPAPNVNITIPNSEGQNGTPQAAPSNPSNNINISVPNPNDRQPLLNPPAPAPTVPNASPTTPQGTASPVNPPVPVVPAQR